ncbi:DUF2510 domain-containing protein [Salinibacterium sp.]|uniref:DUF2510 domain-containing protein n=1 Tax=Salinibacterium sp. TaxID=1915057 RepID=UPI00286D3821|nr:DUF2510 domain-containing protein [Salinibacterium sp.]
MTSPAYPATPAGWYQDPAEPATSRWWDGAQWTDRLQQPYDPASPGISVGRAPENTRVYTPWIWLMVFLPYVTLPLLFTVDFSGIFDGISAGDQGSSTRAQLQIFTSPGYIITVVGGWLTYGLCVLFAFLDRKELIARGVPRPFHWAWTFLYSPVYVIGRSVIVRRRTGGGIAPMWAAIAALVLANILVIAWMAVVFMQLFQQFSTYSTF